MAAAFTSPQCADIFKHLRDLRIDSSVVADQWFQWIGPFCPNLRSFTITTCTDFSPDVLNFIPNKVQTLDVRIFSTFDTDIDESIRWLVCLRKVSSSGRFLELNSLRIFLSQDRLVNLESHPGLNFPQKRSVFEDRYELLRRRWLPFAKLLGSNAILI